MSVNEQKIEGRNAVLEALRADRSVDRVLILDGAHDNALGSIIREVKKHPETKLDFVQKKKLDDLSETGKHQGVIAFTAAYDYASVDDILANAREKGEDPFIFILDGIEDPHNLGAILRTAEAAGADGVILPKRRSASLTQTVFKTSAGAASWIPVARVGNLATEMIALKKQGIWFFGADMAGESASGTDLTGAIGLVIGSEGFGLSAPVRQQCDGIISLPMFGKVNSLNASVAAGILMYEAVRQRGLNK